MWRLFPRSWFAGSPTARAQEQAANALHRSWRDGLQRALSRVLKREVAWTEVSSVLQGLPARHFVALDQALRYGTWDQDLGRPSRGMVRLRVAEPTTVDHEAFLFVAATDPNGFLREQALLELAHSPGRLALAAALIRSDDWVPQVREAARSLLSRAATTAGLFDQLDLIIALHGRRRFKEEIWPTLVEPALRIPDSAEVRRQAARRGSATSRLFAYELLARTDPEQLADTCAEAAVEREHLLALWALRTASESLPSDTVRSLAQGALKHSHGSVRIFALRLFASFDSPGVAAAIQDALFDVSRGTRNLAAHLLRTKFHLEAADTWRAALVGDDGRRGAVALESLAELARAQDVEALLPWTTHRKGKIRAAALRALSRAQYAQLTPLALSLLADESTTVVSEAIAILCLQPGVFTQDLLLSARKKASNERVERRLLGWAQSLDKWLALETYLIWYGEMAPAKHHLLDVEIENWRRASARRFTSLNAAIKARLQERLVVLRNSGPLQRWDDLAHAVDNG